MSDENVVHLGVNVPALMNEISRRISAEAEVKSLQAALEAATRRSDSLAVALAEVRAACVDASGYMQADGTPEDYWCRLCDRRAIARATIAHDEDCPLARPAEQRGRDILEAGEAMAAVIEGILATTEPAHLPSALPITDTVDRWRALVGRQEGGK